MQVNCGVGYLTIVPPSTASDITPIQVGMLQDVQLDYSSSKKGLMGVNQFSLPPMDAEAKLTGKAKFAQIRGAAINAVLAGSTMTTASKKQTIESGTIAAGAVTVSGSANFVDDLGVTDSTGTPYKKVASAPAVGQYSVNVATGVYTFNASDNTKVVIIRYSQAIAGAGKTITLGNQPMGLTTTFKVELYNSTPANNAKTLAGILYAAAFPKLSLPFKNTDFTVQDLDIEAYDDGSGNVAEFYTTE